MMHPVTKLRSPQAGFWTSTTRAVCSSGLHQSSDLDPVDPLWDVVQQEILLTDMPQLYDALVSMWSDKNEGGSEGLQPFTSKVTC